MNRRLGWTLVAFLAVVLPAAAGELPVADRAALWKSLHHPSVTVRLRAALALGEANDAEAIPVLIELLGELPRSQRQPVEELLTRLAGEWAPVVKFPTEDEIGRRIRRDAWMAWWRNTDGEAILGLVRKHVPTPADHAKIQRLLGELSDRKYGVREAAAQELFVLGRIALPQLRAQLKDDEDERSRRLRALIERIEREPGYRLPAAALRILAVRKPAGAAETLLAYLPFVADETQTTEVQQALTGLALRDGKLNPALAAALNDPKPQVRALAAEALVWGGGETGRAAVRKLLTERSPLVRMRVALAFALARQREGVTALIDLLPVLPGDLVGQVEDALYQLAGDTAPDVPLGSEPAEKKKCRDAWVAWWKLNADRVDLARLTTRPSLGFTLISDPGGNRVYEIDRHGKVRWSIENVAGPVDAWMLPGERVLVAEATGQTVCERDVRGKILWQKAVGRNALSVQRLPNGNVFVALDNQVVEVNRAGKEVYAIHNLQGVWDAYRARSGNVVCLMNSGQCLIMDTTGKQLKTFAAKENGASGSLDLLANGRILVAQPQANKVVEFNTDGKKLFEVNAPGVSTATGLSNGHILVASQAAHRVYELDRAGKVVWEKKDTGMAFRARRR